MAEKAIQEPKQETKTAKMTDVAAALHGNKTAETSDTPAVKEQEPAPSMSKQIVDSMFGSDDNFIPTTHKASEVRRLEEAGKPQTGDSKLESSSEEDNVQTKDKDTGSTKETTQQTTDATQGTESMQKSEDTETKTEDGKTTEKQETETAKTYRIKGKDFTEDQIMEAHSSILREDAYTTKIQEANKLLNDNQTRLNEASVIIDKDSVSQPFITMLTSNTEALTEMKQLLSEKFGDKGVKAFEDMAQFNSQTFRHPLKDELDKERAENVQNKADSELDKSLSDFTAANNLTLGSKQQLDDYMVKVFVDSGEKTVLTPQQAFNMLKGEDIKLTTTNGKPSTNIEVIESGKSASEITKTTGTNADSPELITNKGSTPAASSSAKYKKSVQGDKDFITDNKIDMSMLGIR